MFITNTEETAKKIAIEKKKSYGWSVFGQGKWYVGTEEELKKIGVLDPITPTECKL